MTCFDQACLVLGRQFADLVLAQAHGLNRTEDMDDRDFDAQTVLFTVVDICLGMPKDGFDDALSRSGRKDELRNAIGSELGPCKQAKISPLKRV